MDEDICRWITEFILRSSMDDHLQKRVLAVIPVPDKDFRLQKTVLLRAIESEILEADVTEKLLEIFEIIEELDKTEGLPITKSMKAAYCAVAVECTVKYLAVLAVRGIDKEGRYFDAVRRIWGERVMELERSGKSELVSRELKSWKDEIEVTLCDKSVWKKLVNMNTRYDALKLIGDYLSEAWGILGPSFLQLSASLMDKGRTNEMQSIKVEQEADKRAVVSEGVGGNGGVELPSQTENSARPDPQMNEMQSIQVEQEADKRAVVSEDVGGNSGVELPSQTENYARPDPQMNEMQSIQVEQEADERAVVSEDVGGNGGVELPSQTKNFARPDPQGSGQESVEKEVGVSHNPSPSRGGSENLKTSVLHRCKSLASHRRVRGGAKISHPEDLEIGSSSRKYTCLNTPEVNRVQEALKNSSSELEAVVEDPLPDALRIAESVARDFAEKYKTCEHSLEDRNDAGAANPAINMEAVPLRSVNAHSHQIILSRPSIMERNSTACTYEWNDSIDGSPEINHTSRLHLPSPKRKVISPLKRYEETKIVRRRKCKKWTLLEEDTLRNGVQRFGKGNWKLILNSHRDIFDERTEVDLKDKWRNLTKY